MLFASGMAAAVAPFQALKPGDHAVAPTELYWGMRQWLMDFGRAGGLEIDFVDMTDLAALAGGHAARPHPAGLDRDPGQSLLGRHRYRRRGGDRP